MQNPATGRYLYEGKTAVELILGPIKDFTDSYVDDMAVHSDTWELHVKHFKCFLDAILKSGLTLNLMMIVPVCQR